MRDGAGRRSVPTLALMEVRDRLLIEHACRALLADYAVRVDVGDGAGMVALFVPDGVLVRGAVRLVGHAKIPSILGRRPPDLVMRHLLTTTRITVLDPDHAEGLTYYAVYRGRGAMLPLPMPAPFSIGEWYSRFVRTDAGWRLSFMEIRRLFSDAGAG